MSGVAVSQHVESLDTLKISCSESGRRCFIDFAYSLAKISFKTGRNHRLVLMFCKSTKWIEIDVPTIFHARQCGRHVPDFFKIL